jgi:hypothetical protein
MLNICALQSDFIKYIAKDQVSMLLEHLKNNFNVFAWLLLHDNDHLGHIMLTVIFMEELLKEPEELNLTKG